MRILQVVTELGYGGLERLVGHLCLWLQSQGHDVHIAYLAEEADLVSDLQSKGLTITRCPDEGLPSWLYPRYLVRLIRELEPDLVHCHDTAWLKASVACRWVRVPCVQTLHSFLGDWLERHRLWLAWAARSTDFCVGVAPGIEKLYVDILRVPQHKAMYIRNGVPDLYLPHPPAPNWSLPTSPKPVVIGMVARFDEHLKDQPTLVRAMARVRKRAPQAHLVLVGDGPKRNEVERLVAQIGLEENVHFLGMRPDVAVLLHHLDVFVLSSRYEGESLAVLEAMSAQRPIVATAVGGTPGLLENGKCGLLVPPGDDASMAMAILELLENKRKAEELARRARERFLKEYTIDRMGEKYLHLYRHIVSTRGGIKCS